MIEVKHLTKKYGTHLAVDDLSFTIEKGRIYGFLGPNGAGKSTTMNIMTGYIGASSGEVIINGHNILKEPEKAKKCIGYLPEIPPLYLDMTVSEYLYFAAELKKIPKADRNAQVIKVMELIKLVDMKDRLIKTFPKVIAREQVLPLQFLISRILSSWMNRPLVSIQSRLSKSVN